MRQGRSDAADDRAGGGMKIAHFVVTCMGLMATTVSVMVAQWVTTREEIASLKEKAYQNSDEIRILRAKVFNESGGWEYEGDIRQPDRSGAKSPPRMGRGNPGRGTSRP